MQNQPTSSNNQEATKSAPIVTQEVEDPGKASDPAGNQTGNQLSSKDIDPQVADLLEPGEIPQTEPGVSTAVETAGPSKETSEDPLLLETDPGEETDEGASSSNLHAIPIKNPRGRKSKKKKREEATYLVVLEGSQKTLKGIMHTRSKKGTATTSKGATSPTHST